MDQAATVWTTSRSNRWIPVIASIFIQLCLGTAYIWSVFQSHLIIGPSTPDALFHWPATHGTLAYSLLIGVLAIGSTVGGRLTSRFSMRAIIAAAGVILGGGFWLAQYTTESLPGCCGCPMAFWEDSVWEWHIRPPLPAVRNGFPISAV
jgi:hypothetical protein